ncbi:hypothetical protein [Elizabethkingia miricola]|uniref:hypothetical protein n=1 Tax=Elizabethkingia miricola TaxID=172045 RepID=UPI003891EDD4
MKINIYRYITILLILPIILSCRGTTDNIEKGGQTIVKINLRGIVQAQDVSINRSKVTPGVYTLEIPYNKDFNLVTTITPEAEATKIGTQASVNSSALTITPQPPTTNPIGPNVKYLVMVFDESGNRIAAQEKVYDSSNQSDTANQMILNAGKDYTFVAISYNTATAPTFNTAVTNLSDVTNTVSVASSLDYLYFNSGPLNIIYGQQNYINITFKHINSRVILSMDASAEMGNITAVTAHINGAGSINLSANGVAAAGEQILYDKIFTFPVLNRQVVNSAPILVSSAGSVHIINIISVSLNGGVARTNISPVIIPAGTFRQGVSYTVKLSFQATGVLAAGLIWARGNLAYDWVNKIYYNRYYPQEAGSNYKDTDYWNYATNQGSPLVPKMIINSHSDIWNWGNNLYYFTDGINDESTSKIPLNDPCRLVAGGKWRMPFLEDFEKLGVYRVHNGGDISSATDGLPTTTLGGGISHANGNITDNNFPYVYFEGTKEITGIITLLRFYKTGRYYGNVTEADRTAGYQNGGNSAYISDAVIYMARDAYNYDNFSLYRRPYMVVVYNGDRSNGVNTFITQRKAFYHDWSADDRVPVRCVKNP